MGWIHVEQGGGSRAGGGRMTQGGDGMDRRAEVRCRLNGNERARRSNAVVITSGDRELEPNCCLGFTRGGGCVSPQGYPQAPGRHPQALCMRSMPTSPYVPRKTTWLCFDGPCRAGHGLPIIHRVIHREIRQCCGRPVSARFSWWLTPLCPYLTSPSGPRFHSRAISPSESWNRQSMPSRPERVSRSPTARRARPLIAPTYGSTSVGVSVRWSTRRACRWSFCSSLAHTWIWGTFPISSPRSSVS